MTQDERASAGTPSEGAAEPAGGAKPPWTRPEITSFKPVADAQGVSYRIGDGVSNLS